MSDDLILCYPVNSISERKLKGRLLRAKKFNDREDSNLAKNKIPSLRTGNGSWFLDKQKVESPTVQPLPKPNCEFKQNAKSEQLSQMKSLENNRKSHRGSKVCNDDELIRHMSNLPGFLQKFEREKNVQEKALNFGVLDWKRLEKWKYNERATVKHHYDPSSAGSGSACLTTRPPKMGPYQRKQLSSAGSNTTVISRGKSTIPYSRFSPPHGKSPTQHNSSPSSMKKVRNETQFRKENICEGRNMEPCNQEFQAAWCSSNDRHQNCHQKVGNNYRSYSEKNKDDSQRKDKKKRSSPKKSTPSIESGKLMLSLPSDDTVNDGIKEIGNSSIGVELNSQCFNVEPLDYNVLLIPKHLQKNSCYVSSQFMESVVTVDEQSPDATRKRFSNLDFPQDFEELSLDFPSSYPSRSDAKVHAESFVEPHNLVTSQANELDVYKGPCPELNPALIPSEGRCKILHERTTMAPFSVRYPKGSEADTAEEPSSKGRHQFPTRRFSFGLGKMSRSSSFKEIFAVPRLSSSYTTLKSGSMTEISNSMDRFERDKTCASSRVRSSPLRRLLDPLLKYKGSQSTKIVRQAVGPLHSMTSEPLSQCKEPVGVTGQGFLQLTLKNGLPFFKLVVTNKSSNMLAAVVRRLPSYETSNQCMIYTFYSFHENTKRSMTWIQGSKKKSCCPDYNIVAEMKISSFYVPKVQAKDSSHFVIRECVLYSVDREVEDKHATQLLSNNEIAAVVLKSSCQNLNDGNLNDDKRPDEERGVSKYAWGTSFDMGEDENSKSAAVILPGGVHSNPSNGAPSSLISRWRSGGSCDCGGWDVGCKIRVLTNNERSDQILKDSRSSCPTEHVNLFVQGGRRTSMPVFNLESFDNGFYSLKFDPSIPLLEAFATCVAFITSQKFSEILNTRSQEKVLEESIGTNKTKTTATFQGQVPVKYVACPPPSPVGRI